MDKAMRKQVQRGLVELITNSDDAYRDLEDEKQKVSGKIRIEIGRKRKGPSLVKVRDRAVGMSREEMYYKLGTLGRRTSGFEKGKPKRGLHGRGARDVVAFGTVHFESIKGEKYNHLVIPPSLSCRFTEPNARKATQEIRERLGIPRGNGTVVTIEVENQSKIPQHETLLKDFSRYYALRDIFSNPNREVMLADLRTNREDRLTYEYPEGEVVFSDWIQLTDYPEAKVHLIIRQHKTSFEQDYSPCRQGILIKSAAAIHDCTYFGLESEPVAWRFTGELHCKFIDRLVREYDDREEEDPDHPNHPQNNPMRLLDPFRDGLIAEHPFTQSLYGKCKDVLRTLIEKLKASEITPKREVSDESLDKKLRKLSREILKSFEQRLKELEEETLVGPTEGPVKELPMGLHIIPSGEQPIPIVVDEPKTFSVRVKSYEVLDESLPVKISSSDDWVKVRSPVVYLKKFSEDRRTGGTTFTLEGSEVRKESVLIEVRYDGYDGLLLVKVVEPPMPRLLPEGLSFDKSLYRLKINEDKTLTLWLKAGSKITDDEIIADIASDHPQIAVRAGGKCKLHKTNMPGVFVGKCRVVGRQLKAKGNIIAHVEGFGPAQTQAVVEEHGLSGIQIKPDEEDFASLRYKWEPDEDRPQMLIIGAKHPSIRRYLGEPVDGKYPGINSQLYHTVLAEVVAEAFAFRILKKYFIRQGEGGKLDFDTANLYYHRELSNFLSIAHKVLVTDILPSGSPTNSSEI
jgi:hypothetical protein